MTLHLIVSIDTECDKGPGWRVRQPLEFTNVLNGLPQRLQPIFDRHGITASYLLSPEIIRNQACASYFKSLGGRIELGTHLHSEFIPPEDNPATTVTSDFQSDYSQEVEKQKLTNLTSSFVEQFGYAPKCFRAGRFGIGSHSLEILEELGYRVDSSVTPYLWWRRAKGQGVNFLGAPFSPYHPSSEDFRKHGAMKLLEVPVSLINPFWNRFPSGLVRLINPFNRYQTITLHLALKRFLRPKWLRPTYSNTEEMLEVSEWIIQHCEDEHVFLCMMFHSSEFTVGTSPYSSTEDDVQTYCSRVDEYLETIKSEFHIRSISLSQVAELT